MGGTILGDCATCGNQIDYDPLLGGKQYCDDCLTEEMIDDIREDKRRDAEDRKKEQLID